MTFHGEAVALDWTQNVAPAGGPSSYGTPVKYLDGSTYTSATGDDWCVGFYDYNYWDGVDPAEFFLVFEATSGAGSVSITWGFDPDWDLNPAICVNSAGTHDISAGLNVIPLVGVDLPTYFAQDSELTIRVQVSGTFVVDQVRLRIWPPGGALGWWSETITPTTVESADAYWDIRYWEGSASGSGAFADTQTAARAAANLAPLSTGGSNSSTGRNQWGPGTLWMTNILQAVSGATKQSSGGANASVRGIIIRVSMTPSYPQPPGVEGVDWIQPPDVTGSYVELMGDPVVNWGSRSEVSFFHTGGPLVGGGPTAETSSTTHWYSGPGPFYVQAQEGHDLVKPTVAGGDAVIFTPAGAQAATFFDGSYASWQMVDTVDLASLVDAAPRVSVVIFPAALIAYEPHIGVTPYTPIPPPLYPEIAGSGITPVPGDFDPDPARRSSVINYQPLNYTFIRAPHRYWDPAGIAPEIFEPMVPAGYFLDPNANLDGLGDGVDVNFS